MGPVTLSALTTPKKAALQLELSHRREQQVRVVFPVVRSIGEELYRVAVRIAEVEALGDVVVHRGDHNALCFEARLRLAKTVNSVNLEGNVMGSHRVCIWSRCVRSNRDDREVVVLPQ